MESGTHETQNSTEHQHSRPVQKNSPFIFKRRSVLWTEDTDNGLPGAPPVQDFFQPMPRKKIAPELLPAFPWFTTVALSTLILLFVTFLDWSTPSGSFAASAQEVFGRGQYEKLVLSMFSHSDAPHLLSNLLGFVGFGYLLRRHFGFLAFPIVPFLIGLLTTLVTISMMQSHHSLIGSSGIVYAQVGLYVTLYFLYEQRYPFIEKTIRVIGFMLVLFFPNEYSENTSYLAHTVGFALGVAAAFVLRPFVSAKIFRRNHVKEQPSAAPGEVFCVHPELAEDKEEPISPCARKRHTREALTQPLGAGSGGTLLRYKRFRSLPKCSLQNRCPGGTRYFKASLRF